MSTNNRRVTRASSRGTASTRGLSPPILDLHNLINNEVDATPAARKARGESLPAIVPRESTAYGGAGIAMPASIKRTERGPLEKTLENMLEEEEEDELATQPEPARPRRSKTPSLSRATPTRTQFRPKASATTGLGSINENAESRATNNGDNTPAPTIGRASTVFDTPSAINAEAGFRTPRFYGTAGQIREAPSPMNRPSRSPQAPQNAWEQPNRRTPVRQMNVRNPPPSSLDRFWKSLINNIINPFLSGFRGVFSWMTANWMWVVAGISCALIAANCSSGLGNAGVESRVNSRGYHWYGITDFQHNFGQLIPAWLARPTTSLDADGMQVVGNLLDRMRTAEYDIEYLKRQVSLDEKSISVLEKSLPDFIVSKKDKSGNLQIPQDFWNALKDKIHEEPWEFTTGSGSTTDISSNDIKRMAPKLWDEWMEKNEAKIRAWKAQDFEQAYNNHIKASFKNEALVSKSDLVKMLEDNYKSSNKDVHNEIKKLSAHLETEIQSAKTEAKRSSMSKDEINKLIADYFKKTLPKTQLEALAQANLNNNLKTSLARLNHFSHKTGAIIMPHLTAPNYDFTPNRGRWLSRTILWFLGRGLPSPKGPYEALTSWEEHGDCWCAPGPEKDAAPYTAPPQLGVLTGRNMYPDEIIIEHVPEAATLNPGSAPREMEVLVYIEDEYTRRPLQQQSLNLIPNQKYDPTIEDGYIRIAKFTYDRDGPSAQAFPTQVRLADFVGRLGPEYSDGESPNTLKPFTRKIIIRSLSNYGEDFTCLYKVRVHGEIALEEEYESSGSMEADEVI